MVCAVTTGAQVQYLVGELRPHNPCVVAIGKKKKKDWVYLKKKFGLFSFKTTVIH